MATNLTFSVLKPELSRVYSAKELASSLGGCVLNVVKIKTPAELRFHTANVNFYTPAGSGGINPATEYTNQEPAHLKMAHRLLIPTLTEMSVQISDFLHGRSVFLGDEPQTVPGLDNVLDSYPPHLHHQLSVFLLMREPQ